MNNGTQILIFAIIGGAVGIYAAKSHLIPFGPPSATTVSTNATPIAAVTISTVPPQAAAATPPAAAAIPTAAATPPPAPAPAAAPSGKTIVCPRAITAWSPTEGGKVLGQFEKGTVLTIDESGTIAGFYKVSFPQTNGTAITALCRASDFNRGFAWLEDYDQAMRYAREDRKLVLMDFTGSDWCGWCMKLESEVFSQPEFKEYAEKNLILLRLDFPHHTPQSPSVKSQNEKLAQQYGIDGFPTIIVLNASGSKVGTLGYMEGGPRAFVAELQKLQP
ncbi:MAG: thioredoxin family protein [Verrucomicrobiae bacterium]|nr:thioredoxin family protein [Verrucomicrobiae bacterium]